MHIEMLGTTYYVVAAILGSALLSKAFHPTFQLRLLYKDELKLSEKKFLQRGTKPNSYFNPSLRGSADNLTLIPLRQSFL